MILVFYLEHHLSGGHCHHVAHHLPHHVYAGVPLHPHLTHDPGHLVWQSSSLDLRYQPRLQLRDQVHRPVQNLLRWDSLLRVEKKLQSLHFFSEWEFLVFSDNFPGTQDVLWWFVSEGATHCCKFNSWNTSGLFSNLLTTESKPLLSPAVLTGLDCTAPTCTQPGPQSYLMSGYTLALTALTLSSSCDCH